MFRKDEEMAGSWETFSASKCAVMQRDILQSASRMLAPGGRIVYSTCTFAPEENEATIARFLDEHTDYEIAVDDAGKFSPGRPEWIDGTLWTTGETFSSESTAAVAGTYRLWPHKLAGEGHYVAVLQHKGDSAMTSDVEQEEASHGRKRSKQKRAAAKPQPAVQLSEWFEFMSDHLQQPLQGNWVVYGDHVYWSDWGLPDLSGITVARPGWFVGTIKKNRFVPSQALAMGLRSKDAARSLLLGKDDPQTIR